MNIPSPVPEPDPSQVLTRAVLRAADFLALTQEDLAAILGTSPASVSRMASGKRRLERPSGGGRMDAGGAGGKEFELACLFLRVYRSLDALVGGDLQKGRAWLTADNRHLGGAPLTLIKTIPGIAHVADYLDAMRGKT